MVWLTKSEQMVQEQINKINQMQADLASMLPQRLSALSQESLLQYVSREKNGLYKVIPIQLTTAQTQPKVYQYKGGVIAVEFYDGAGNKALTGQVEIRFNSSQNDPIKFNFGDYLVHPFNELWVSYSGQAGIIANLIIGYEFDNIFRLQRNTNANISTVSLVSAITGLTEFPGGSSIVNGDAYSPNSVAENVLMYTVPAGKTFKMTSGNLWALASSHPCRISLEVTNAADVTQYTFMTCVSKTSGQPGQLTQTFTPAYVLPAGYKIKLRKYQLDTATYTSDPDAYGNVTGYVY